ncbi:hypothetical protein H1235_09455 [Pseudoxanthomonas sp. NC8]|nr:hypothetical protein H1235_09455 [Pseudoxanthomonas sp. NC8]
MAGLVALADRIGVPCDGWFDGLRLSRAQFRTEAPAYLSYRQACEIVRRALRTLPGEGHGRPSASRRTWAISACSGWR